MSPSTNTRPTKILRVSRSDERDKDASVILYVQPSAATIPLNVAITATDGSDGYGLTLKDSKAKQYKDSSSDQTDDDWKAVLRAVLLGDAPKEDLHWLNNTELTALVKKDGISISIREDVGGIRRRLGILVVPPQDDVEIELWEWLDRVCKEKDDAERRYKKAEKEAAENQAKLERLEKQLQNLSEAKKKHEDVLIIRFQQLLNEKKRMIRNLSSGTSNKLVPKETDDELEADVSSAKKRKGKASTKALKRKQLAEAEEEEEQSDDHMQIDDNQLVAASDNDRIETVDRDVSDQQISDDDNTLDESTEDEDEDEL